MIPPPPTHPLQILLFLQQMGPLHCASLLDSESGWKASGRLPLLTEGGQGNINWSYANTAPQYSSTLVFFFLVANVHLYLCTLSEKLQLATIIRIIVAGVWEKELAWLTHFISSQTLFSPGLKRKEQNSPPNSHNTRKTETYRCHLPSASWLKIEHSVQRCEGVEVSGEVWQKKNLLHQYFLTSVAALHDFFSRKTPTISLSSNRTAEAQIHNRVHCKLARWPCMHGLWHQPPPLHRHHFCCKAAVDASGFALTHLPACTKSRFPHVYFVTPVPCVEFVRCANEA